MITGGEIAAIIGALAALIMWFYERRERRKQQAATAHKTDAEAGKTEAEGAVLLSQAWKSAFDNLESSTQAQITALTRQMACLETEQGKTRLELAKLERLLQRAYGRIEHLMDIIRRLGVQIRRLGEEPCEQPTDWKPDEEE